MKYRPTPCETCGWKFPGFHICIDPNKPVDAKIVKKHNNQYIHTQTASWRQRSTETANARWERHREEMRGRDSKIVERYKEGDVGIKTLSVEFGIAFQTVRGILQRAEARGEVVIRHQGQPTNKAYSRDRV